MEKEFHVETSLGRNMVDGSKQASLPQNISQPLLATAHCQSPWSNIVDNVFNAESPHPFFSFSYYHFKDLLYILLERLSLNEVLIAFIFIYPVDIFSTRENLLSFPILSSSFLLNSTVLSLYQNMLVLGNTNKLIDPDSNTVVTRVQMVGGE